MQKEIADSYSRYREELESEERIETLETHTVGEPTRIIFSGFPAPQGDTIMQCREYCEKNYDHYRRALMAEPRGHKDMVGAVLLEPKDPRADLGVIYMDANRWINMCGHATIGCATAAVNAGLVKIEEPVTKVVFDTPAGLIETEIQIEKRKAAEVSFENIPSFLYGDNFEVQLDDGRKIPFSVAYAGSFFALVDVEKLGRKVGPESVSALRHLAMETIAKINETMEVRHPFLNICGVANMEFYEQQGRDRLCQKNIVVSAEGQVDRSPCGTGTSAKLAWLFAKKKIEIGEELTNKNFTGAVFRGCVKEVTSVGDYMAIIPRITGSAYIAGAASYVMRREDPYRWGFALDI